MVRLFISDRILIDGDFYNGGIAVNGDGKIEEVFKNQTTVDEWLDSTDHVEVINGGNRMKIEKNLFQST